MTKPPKLLMLSAYFPPEPMPTESLQYQLLDAFCDAGFSIEVICPIPSRGISKEIRNQYKRKKSEWLNDNCVLIRRFYMPREGKKSIVRAFRYLLYSIIVYFKAVRVKDADILFCASTPPTQGMLCGLVKRRLKIPFVYNLQDIFPDSMVSAGMTTNESLIWKIGRKIEDYTYRHADKIIVISNQGKSNLLLKGVPGDKLEVIYNWVDTDQIVPVPREQNRLFDELMLHRHKFYVTYAGNLGPIQNVGLLLDAAELLKDKQDIQFVIFGAGAEWEHLSERAQELSNVKVFPLMPKDRLSEVYSLGDLSLVIARKGLGAASVPSKTWSILAAGTPVLLSFDEGSELWDLVKKNQLGICVEAGDKKRLSNAIYNTYIDRNTVEAISSKLKRFVDSYASYKTCSEQYIQALKSIFSYEHINRKD